MNQPIKRAFLDTEDGQILYRIGGEGEPLLLLHMNPRSSDEFRELMPILAPKRRVIAMDLMGFGDSDKPPRLYSVADYAKTVIALLDELGIEKTNLLGNHTGAFVAGEVAAAYPDRVKKMILGNVAGFGEEGQADLFQRFEEGFKIKEDGSHLMERWLARSRYVGSAELNHRWVLDDLKCFGYPLYAVWAVGNYCLDAAERFKSLQCPTLILWGIDDVEEFERLGLAKARDRYFVSQAIPHGKVVELEGGTICMMNQMPEKIAKVVVDFLDEAGA
ncbi:MULTISPECIES: alpha/beta fold hydrolase [unclassified Coleofasciculus]|uniref:alpha/beta fold hydrolase n=1 Tax=unclassified Coleofasciculus TaxID=2692782 RepID=UPI00187E408E|nr:MULTISPECIES: alpha/beta hydrolase [unclassified Coleofasciculus]MBE9125140.1 alpha/beta hydrolase [Coleofasciculus sp. LEGE 07081]MBE9148357.1 alpha/beta hydrolase [Coleofasciculus sp. LEGE 07092]